MPQESKDVPKEVLRAFHDIDEKTYTKDFASKFFFPEVIVVHRKKIYVAYLLLGFIVFAMYLSKPGLEPPYFMEVDLP